MSLKKKIEKTKAEAFSEACDIWELALFRTKGIGPKRRAAIMNSVQQLATEMKRGKGAGN